MRTIFTFSLFILVSLSLYVQQTTDDQHQALQLIAEDSSVTKYLAEFVDYDEVKVTPDLELKFYKDDLLVQPAEQIELKKVKLKEEGLYKVTIAVNKHLKITTKIVYHSKCDYWRKSIYVRESNWLLGDGQMYLYAFHN